MFSTNRVLPKISSNLLYNKYLAKFNFLRSFQDFCISTQMHGLNYIFRPNINKYEQMFWIIIIVIAIIVAVILLSILWGMLKVTPIVTVIESTHHSIWNIPFPAVTICSFNRISKCAAMKLAKSLEKGNISTEYLAKLFRLIMDFNGSHISSESEYIKLHQVLAYNNWTVSQLSLALAPKCENLLLRCMWKGTQKRCKSLFNNINTSIGPCCSFNYNDKLFSKPRHITTNGYKAGLSVLIDPMVNDYFGSYMSSEGIRILTHDPYDFPADNAETKIITVGWEAFINLLPEATYATQAVRQMNMKNRYCIFHNERKLNVMNFYSYSNCIIECRSYLAYEACGCIPFNYPNNGSFPICQMDKAFCFMNNKKFINEAIPQKNTSKSKSYFYCDCMPDCELLLYPAEITVGGLDARFSYSSINFFKDIRVNNEILFHIYFEDLVYTRYRKDIFLNWVSAFASFGGLLGLIIGFSIVSAIEFIYFFIVMPIFTLLPCRKRSNVLKL